MNPSNRSSLMTSPPQTSPFSLTYGEETKLPLTVCAAAFHVNATISQQHALVDVRLTVCNDSVGKDTFMASLDCLQPRGYMVSFGQSSGPVGPVDLVVLNQRGGLYVTRPSLFHYTSTKEELRATAKDLFDVVGSGKVKVGAARTYPLAEAAQAHRDLEARATTGATVLLP